MAGITDAVTALQNLVRTVGSIGQTLANQKELNPPKYTVATLPAVSAADQGDVAYVTNGRNTGEGVGAGTGCLASVNSAGVWASVWSGVVVVA